MSQTELRQAEQIKALRAEIAALRAIETPALSAGGVVAQMLGLPGLRGLWPMSGFNSAGSAEDVSGSGNLAAYTGNPTYSRDGLVPYIDLDGAGDYLTVSDRGDLDILGTEAYVANPGLTMGGWFYFDDATPAAIEQLVGKYSTSASSYSYWIHRATDTTLKMGVRLSSTNYDSGASAAVGAGAWRFIVGRYIPSTSLSIYVNGVWTTNTTSIPASIDNSTAPFTIGNEGGGSLEMDGRASLCFLCASALSDTMVELLFQTSRGLFGV